MIVVTELHYHRNGVGGDGYYAGRATWTPEDEKFEVMFVAFVHDYPAERGKDNCAATIAILGNNDVATSYRYEDFERGLRKFIHSRGGQALAFPHTIIDRSADGLVCKG